MLPAFPRKAIAIIIYIACMHNPLALVEDGVGVRL